jgi:nucleotide-binding universal stress UspA family protein
MADKFGASLRLLHVVRDPFTTMMTGVQESHDHHHGAHYFDGVPDLVELRDVLIREAGKQIVQRIAALDRAGLHAAGEALMGFDARNVVDYAASHGVDLIVMGTHGGGRSRLLIGRFAGRVIRTAPCAVMTVCQAGGKRCSPDARNRGENPCDELQPAAKVRASGRRMSDGELKRREPEQRVVKLTPSAA